MSYSLRRTNLGELPHMCMRHGVWRCFNCRAKWESKDMRKAYYGWRRLNKQRKESQWAREEDRRAKAANDEATSVPKHRVIEGWRNFHFEQLLTARS